LLLLALAHAEEDFDDDDDLLADLDEEDDELETYEIGSPKEVNDRWMEVIREVVIKKKQKLGLSYGDATHTEAMGIARAREAIRPNRTERGLAAALLQAPPGSSAQLLAAPEGGGEGEDGGSDNSSAVSQAFGGNSAVSIHLDSIGANGQSLVTKEMYQKATELSNNISKGALASVGALIVRDSAREYQRKVSVAL
jgi:hypothetical protein